MCSPMKSSVSIDKQWTVKFSFNELSIKVFFSLGSDSMVCSLKPHRPLTHSRERSFHSVNKHQVRISVDLRNEVEKDDSHVGKWPSVLWNYSRSLSTVGGGSSHLHRLRTSQHVEQQQQPCSHLPAYSTFNLRKTRYPLTIKGDRGILRVSSCCCQWPRKQAELDMLTDKYHAAQTPEVITETHRKEANKSPLVVISEPRKKDTRNPPLLPSMFNPKPALVLAVYQYHQIKMQLICDKKF